LDRRDAPDDPDAEPDNHERNQREQNGADERDAPTIRPRSIAIATNAGSPTPRQPERSLDQHERDPEEQRERKQHDDERQGDETKTMPNNSETAEVSARTS